MARFLPCARERPPDAGSATGRGTRRTTWFLASAIALAIVLWIVLVFSVEQARFVVVATRAQVVGAEIASSCARLFAALVLILFPETETRLRMRWIAGGFIVLGMGGLIFGYLYPLLSDEPAVNVSMYGALLFRVIAGLFFAVGLLAAAPPRISPRLTIVTFVVLATLSVGLVAGGEHLPTLANVSSLEQAARDATATLRGLTGWHWGFSLAPLLLALATVAGSARHFPGTAAPGWLVIAMVLWAGAQVHNLFWPAAYSPVLTTSNLLRLVFSVVVAIGGVLELRRVAAERAALLALEREAAARLANLAALRDDFTAMVAHELGSPIAAIQRSADVVALDPLSPVQAHALATITAETRLISALVGDVQAIARVERDDFAIYPVAVPVATLLAQAAGFAGTLRGDHPFACAPAIPDRVRADPERIGQVLRNLLSNAAKYSPPGSPIELRTERHGDRVRLAIADQGYGIAADERERIFEKYARGRQGAGPSTTGAGLGLYLSQRIVQAHGGTLSVTSTPGVGSVFAFDLEVVE